VPSKWAFDPRFHVTRSATITKRTNRDNSTSLSFHVPWTKTTKEEGAVIILTAHDDDLCPMKALILHSSMNPDLPDYAPFFAFRSSSGFTIPVKSSFLSLCSSIWLTAGLPPVHGHSFRIRGATELLMAGVAPEVVARQGGWTSLAFLLYWRKLEQILPMNITDAYKKKRLQELALEMDSFHSRNNISDTAVSSLVT
jgi:hypothetical protein